MHNLKLVKLKRLLFSYVYINVLLKWLFAFFDFIRYIIYVEKTLKPYNHYIEKFLIKKLKLKPNYYTPNDYFYIISGQDYEVAYNPRCQLLDITPVQKDKIFGGKLLAHQCQKIEMQVNKWFGELCMDFFLAHGQHFNQFMVVRLYGVQSDSFPYITYLTENNFNEWDEVENWQELGKRYLKNKYFKYGFYGEHFKQSPPVPSKYKKKKNKKVKTVLPEHIKLVSDSQPTF